MLRATADIFEEWSNSSSPVASIPGSEISIISKDVLEEELEGRGGKVLSTGLLFLST